jgi:hypothetical protein
MYNSSRVIVRCDKAKCSGAGTLEVKLLVIKGRAKRDILAHQEEINLCRGKMEDFLSQVHGILVWCTQWSDILSKVEHLFCATSFIRYDYKKQT